MKTFYIIGTMLIVLNLHSNELEWVDKQIDAIKPSREGLIHSTIISLKDPIIFLEKNKSETTTKEKVKSAVSLNSRTSSSSTNSIIPPSTTKKRVFKTGLVLEAVINNSALISGKWYRLDDSVKSYKLSKVERTSVVLTRNGKTKRLSTRTKNNTLKFKK